MIVSMTGFGIVTRSTRQFDISAEFRSVNSKYLEISLKIPPALTEKENELKELISKKITRGKVSLSLSVFPRNSRNDYGIDTHTIKHYAELLRYISKVAGIDEPVRIEHILKFSDIFKTDDSKHVLTYWSLIKKIVMRACDDLLKMKLREGKMLKMDILKRIKNISSKIKKITLISERNLSANKRKLEEKVKLLISEYQINADMNRLEYELLMISERLDVTEEIVRTRSHLDYFLKELRNESPSGRRLNFLVQEINREVNTIASKASNSSISHIVVEIKEELEKIKEQLQNVE